MRFYDELQINSLRSKSMMLLHEIAAFCLSEQLKLFSTEIEQFSKAGYKPDQPRIPLDNKVLGNGQMAGVGRMINPFIKAIPTCQLKQYILWKIRWHYFQVWRW